MKIRLVLFILAAGLLMLSFVPTAKTKKNEVKPALINKDVLLNSTESLGGFASEDKQ